MPLIQVFLDEEADKFISILRIKGGHKTKADAILALIKAAKA